MKKEYRESEIRAHYRALTLWLIEQKLTITTMESATAGQIASLITDTAVSYTHLDVYKRQSCGNR